MYGCILDKESGMGVGCFQNIEEFGGVTANIPSIQFNATNTGWTSPSTYM
jgi:hypothetical protein